MRTQIFSDSSISIDGIITGYYVRQHSEGTKVRPWTNNGCARPYDLGDLPALPQHRYTLSNAIGLAEFDHDFCALVDAFKKQHQIEVFMRRLAYPPQGEALILDDYRNIARNILEQQIWKCS